MKEIATLPIPYELANEYMSETFYVPAAGMRDKRQLYRKKP